MSAVTGEAVHIAVTHGVSARSRPPIQQPALLAAGAADDSTDVRVTVTATVCLVPVAVTADNMLIATVDVSAIMFGGCNN